MHSMQVFNSWFLANLRLWTSAKRRRSPGPGLEHARTKARVAPRNARERCALARRHQNSAPVDVL